MPYDRLRLRLVDDAAPEQVAVVRGERVDLLALRVESQREVLVVLDPEIAVEAALELRGLLLELVGERRVLPHLARQPRAAHLRVVGVALELAGRAREAGKPAVAVRDRVPGVLPALVLEPRLLVAALVPDVAVALEVGVLVDPVQGRPGLELEARERASGRPSSARTRRAARRRAGSRPRSRSRASAAAPRTPSARRSASRGGSGRDPRRGSRRSAMPCQAPSASRVVAASSGVNGQRLQAREDAVAAEHGHEPGQAGGGQASPAGDGGEKRRAARSTRLRR